MSDHLKEILDGIWDPRLADSLLTLDSEDLFGNEPCNLDINSALDSMDIDFLEETEIQSQPGRELRASAPASISQTFNSLVNMPQPVMAQPLLVQPLLAQQLIAQPIITQPMITQPIMAQPIMTQSIMAQPLIGQPLMIQPVMALLPIYGSRNFLQLVPDYSYLNQVLASQQYIQLTPRQLEYLLYLPVGTILNDKVFSDLTDYFCRLDLTDTVFSRLLKLYSTVVQPQRICNRPGCLNPATISCEYCSAMCLIEGKRMNTKPLYLYHCSQFAFDQAMVANVEANVIHNEESASIFPEEEFQRIQRGRVNPEQCADAKLVKVVRNLNYVVELDEEQTSHKSLKPNHFVWNTVRCAPKKRTQLLEKGISKNSINNAKLTKNKNFVKRDHFVWNTVRCAPKKRTQLLEKGISKNSINNAKLTKNKNFVKKDNLHLNKNSYVNVKTFKKYVLGPGNNERNSFSAGGVNFNTHLSYPAKGNDQHMEMRNII